MSEKKSWFTWHPHVTRFAYVAVTLIVVLTLVFTFGRDTVKVWIEGTARSFGYEITAVVEPEVKPEPEGETQ